MKKSVFLLWCVLLLNFPGKAAETLVNGTVHGGNGLVVRLMTYTDQVSYLRKTLAESLIGEDEDFQFIIDLDETIYAWLDIEFRQGDIYLQPGQVYDVQIQLDEHSLSTSYYDRVPLSIEFIKDDPDRLNLYIKDFNELYNDFMLNYAGQHAGKSMSGSYNAFKTAVGLRFQNASNSYFRDYMKYKSASMEMFMRLKSRDKLGMEYLSGQPVAYTNIEYMDFFHLYFEKYFLSGYKYFNFNKTYDLINGTAPLDAILDSLGVDPVLKTTEIRQLVMLSGLKELYPVSGFDKARIVSLVNSLVQTGQTQHIKDIAGNLLIRFNRLQPGSPAPDFALPSIDHHMDLKLSDLKGKYVYLVFFDSKNPASQAEMAMVDQWYEDYNKKVSFIAVSVDKDPSSIMENPNISRKVWTILDFNDNLDLLESYDANTFPYFVLIDDQGRIVSCPAQSPSENIMKALDSI